MPPQGKRGVNKQKTSAKTDVASLWPNQYKHLSQTFRNKNPQRYEHAVTQLDQLSLQKDK
jgi:hypothetical protein